MMIADKEQKIVQYVQSEFNKFQGNTLQSLQKIVAAAKLDNILIQSPDTVRKIYFDILLNHANDELTLELFDKEKHTIAWAVNYGPQVDTIYLNEIPISSIVQRPIYSYLIVLLPLKDGQTIVGYLVGKRLFDVNYPINNRFINSGAFDFTFTSTLDIAAKFDFSLKVNNERAKKDISVPLYSINHQLLGHAYFSSPTVTELVDSFRRGISSIRLFFIPVIFILSIIMLWRWKKSTYLWSKYLFILILLWLFRYLLIWLNIPANIITIEYFEPKYFASPFGFGIARSFGDLFVSSVFLIISIGICAYDFFITQNNVLQGINTTRWNKIVQIVIALILLLLILLLTRGFVAVINSAVFDSSLEYANPTEVFPSFELSIMLISLFFITASILLVNVGLILFLNKLIDGFSKSNISGKTSWLITVGVLLLSSIFFGIVQRNSLLGQEARIILLMLFVFLSIRITGTFQKYGYISKIKLSFFTLGISLLMLLPVLKDVTRKAELSFVELLSNEISRPIDHWLTLLVNKTLDEASNEDTKNILTVGDQYEISKLAFTKWAASILSREGNNCSIVFYSPQNEIISEFHIGNTSSKLKMFDSSAVMTARRILTEERTQYGTTTQWYIGYCPIIDQDSIIIGQVLVGITGSKQDFLKGELPEVLRNYRSGSSEAFQRRIILSEYINGELFRSTSEVIPKDKSFPEELISEESSSSGRWISETVDGQKYESYYFKDQRVAVDNLWYALSIVSEDITWFIYWYIKDILFFLLVIGAIIVIIFSLMFLFRKQLTFSFVTKLIIAFVIVSILPILILVDYNRQYAIKRTTDDAIKQLGEQTNLVAKELQRRYGLHVPVSFDRLQDEECIQLTNEINTDFDVYFLSTIDATSKPEMYKAEFIDHKMSAGAYLNIVLRQKEFYTENRTIGDYSYIVGYRSLVADDGTVIGAVAVPTLYKKTEIDEELASRNVFLYGAYSVALILSIILSIMIAHQFAIPIRRLKNATSQVASGNLDVRLESGRNDELGDLEQAFGQMTLNLKTAQEQMIKAQREAAWKEMAKQIAHEIKNPLTPIKLSIQHLRQAYQDGVEDFKTILHQVTTTVLDQIETLSKIATEFSHFARMPERKLERVDVHGILTHVITIFQEYKGVKFKTDFKALIPILEADREELSRSFLNIIRNSIQAMQEKGTVYIRTQTNDKFVEISINDSGPGIPIGIQKHLFEPNFSTKTDGMGLGLSIVKKTINDLGGTIQIESNIREGTTVRICLPRA
ncbi:MAG: HAMP domain-containing protein [Ignavibacteriales bacterium]|nr:HAMP domain-containing protein [Ignavibacteriales bacterium]